MADDRTSQHRGDNANIDQHSSGSTGGSSTASSSGSQANRSQNASPTGERQRSIQTSNEQARGPGMTRRQAATPGNYAVPGSPFSLLRRMAEDMDRLFQRGWVPQIETFRRGDKLVLRADLPGLKKEDVNVEIEDGILTISGERSNEDVDDRDGYYHSERSYGQFQRSLALPEGITGDSCDATFKDGVLEVTIPVPKQAERGAKKVQVR